MKPDLGVRCWPAAPVCLTWKLPLGAEDAGPQGVSSVALCDTVPGDGTVPWFPPEAAPFETPFFEHHTEFHFLPLLLKQLHLFFFNLFTGSLQLTALQDH